MNVRLASQQQRYIVGEKMQFDLHLENTSADVVHLDPPDAPNGDSPHFVVQGPSYPKPHRVHWAGREPRATAEPVQQIALQPGSSVTHAFQLPMSLKFADPGAHEVFATYAVGGSEAESNRVSVHLDAPAGTPQFRIVGRTPLRSEVGIQAAAAIGNTLYLATFLEDRPDLGETSFRGLAQVLPMGSGAVDVFAPWCASAELGFITPRFGWRNGNTITVAGFRKAPQKLDLAFRPRIQGPSLMSANGDIDLLVTSEDGTRLALLHFPNVDYGQPPPPARLLWEKTLAQPVTDLTSSINPAGERIAVLRQGSAVTLLRLTDAAPDLATPVEVEGKPVPAVLPALHISQSGVVRASVLSTTGAGSVVLTEIVWSKGGTPQKKTAAPITLASPIRSGTVAYTMSAVETPRREWLFVLESHRALHSRSEGRAYIPKRDIVSPPQLLVMSQLTYDLEFRNQPMLYPID